MREFLEYLEYVKLFANISLVTIVVTYIIYRIFKNMNSQRFVKFIPGLILIIIGSYYFIKFGSCNSIMDGIKYIASALIGIGSGVVGMFFALILDIYNKPNKKKNRNQRT